MRARDPYIAPGSARTPDIARKWEPEFDENSINLWFRPCSRRDWGGGGNVAFDIIVWRGGLEIRSGDVY